MAEILYRSPALEVRRVTAGDGRRQVVTFDSYHEPPGFDRPGFGEAFFLGEDITAIHVMCYGNDWFQYPEIKDVLAIIGQACSRADRVMSYGSSMGGYAAIRFAAAIGAHSVLALSPQYSLDRRKTPFEERWASDRRRIRFLAEIETPIEQVPLMIQAYDSRLDADRSHAVRLSAEAAIQELPLPFAGHPVGPFLNDIGLLRPLVLAALDGAFDLDHFRSYAAGRARLSPHWLANLAERHPRAQGNRGIALARRAVTLAPDRPDLHDALARRLAASGHYTEAIEAHHRAIEIEPIVDYLWGYSKTLAAAGDVAAALDVIERIQRIAPHTAGYHAWAARLREGEQDWHGALADIRNAIRHDRANPRYRLLAYSLQWRLITDRIRSLLFG